MTTINNVDLVRIVLWFCSDLNGMGERIFISNIRLQKLVFLSQNEIGVFEDLRKKEVFVDEKFMFRANNFGPFSVDLVKLVNGRLKRDKELSINNKGYAKSYIVKDKLKEELAVKYAELKDDNDFIKWVGEINRYGKLSTDELLRLVYTNSDYSKYLVNSKIKDKYI